MFSLQLLIWNTDVDGHRTLPVASRLLPASASRFYVTKQTSLFLFDGRVVVVFKNKLLQKDEEKNVLILPSFITCTMTKHKSVTILVEGERERFVLYCFTY